MMPLGNFIRSVAKFIIMFRVNINPLIVRAISSTLLAGQHLIIEDELITLLHHTFYENKVCDLQSIFTDSLPKHLTVSITDKTDNINHS